MLKWILVLSFKPKLNKNFQDILRKIEKLSKVARLVVRMVRRASLVIRMA